MSDSFEVSLTPGCSLRQLQQTDSTNLFKLIALNKDRLRRWLPWLKDDYSYSDTEAFIRQSTDQFEREGILNAGIWVGRAIAGCVGIRDFNPSDQTAAIGYWLGQSYEGRGLMTLAVGAIADYAFDVLQINRLEIRCGVDNLRSRAIPERLGFKPEGTLRESQQVFNRSVDLIVYSMLSHEHAGMTGSDTDHTQRKDSHNELRCKPPKTWSDSDHFLHSLNDPWYKSLLKIQNAISISTVQFFQRRGLSTLHLPITTNSISSPMGLGSDSKPVKINLLGIETYLADSMQFFLEYGLRILPNGCYYLMPSFRGESADKRHLCQFYHAEAEICGTLTCVMRLVEKYLQTITREVIATCGTEIERIAGSMDHVENLLNSHDGFPRITFQQAIEILSADSCFIVEHASGARHITHDGEIRLLNEMGGFVWLTHFDHLSVPFYQAFGEDPATARAADLLFGMGEIVGAGERHVTESQVREAITLHGVDQEPYDWYCRMKRHHPKQTAGFGLGTERYICWLFQHDDIRDCQIIPRFNKIHSNL